MLKTSKILRIFISIAVSAFSVPIPSFAANPSTLSPIQIGPPAPTPTGSTVVSGSANVSQSGTSTNVNVNSSGTTTIEWNSFNIANGYSVNFNQLSSSDLVINKVTGAWGPSSINGNFTANGNVWILNPYGVAFGANANVNVGGLLAGAGTINPNVDGSWDFESTPGASVTNMGRITINHPNGYAALLGAEVSNAESITADQGTIALAAAQGVTVNMPLNNSISIVLNTAAQAPVSAFPGFIGVVVGQAPLPAPSSVSNIGSLQANGGQVLMQAYVNNLPAGAYAVNTTGTIMSNSLNGKNGNVQLSAITDGSGQGGINVGGTVSGDNIAINSPNSSINLSNGAIESNPTSGNADIYLSATSIDSINENISAASAGGNAAINLISNTGDIDYNNGWINASGITGNIEIQSAGNINLSSGVLESLGFSGNASIGLLGNSVNLTDTAMEAGSYSLPSYNQGSGAGTIDITSLDGDVDIQGGGTYTALGNTAYLNFNASNNLNIDSIYAVAEAGNGANVNFISGGALNFTNSYLWALPGQYSGIATGDSNINFQSAGNMSLSDDQQLYATSSKNSSINLISDGSLSVDTSTIKSTGSLNGVFNITAGHSLDNATLSISSSGLIAAGASTNLTVLNNSSGNLIVNSDNLSSKGSSGLGNLIISNWGANSGQGSVTYEGSNTLSGDSVITSTNNINNISGAATTINANEYEIDSPNSPIYLSGGSIIVNPISGDANITLIGSSVGLDNENLYATALNGNASIDIEGTTAVSIFNSRLDAVSIANGSGTINVTSSGGPGNIVESTFIAQGSSGDGSINLSSGGLFTIDSNSIFKASGQGAQIDLDGSGLDVSDATFTADGGVATSGASIKFSSATGEIDLNNVNLDVNAAEGLALIDISAGDEGNTVFNLNIDTDPLGLGSSTFNTSGQSAQIQMYATGTLNLGSTGGLSDTLTAKTTSILDSYADITLSGDNDVNVNGADMTADASAKGSVGIEAINGNVSISNSKVSTKGNSTDANIGAIQDGSLSIDSSSLVNSSADGDSSIELNGLAGINISKSNLTVNSFNSADPSLQGDGKSTITLSTAFDNITNSTLSMTGNTANLQINASSNQISGSSFLAAGGDGAVIDITSDDGVMNITNSTLNAVIGNPDILPAGDSSITLQSYDNMDLNSVHMNAYSTDSSSIDISSSGLLTVENSSSLNSEGGQYQEIKLSSSDDMKINDSSLSTDTDQLSAGESIISLDSGGLIDVFDSQINSQGGEDSTIQLTADTTISEENASISALSAIALDGDAEVTLSADGDINLSSSSNTATVNNANTGNATSDVSSSTGNVSLGNATISATAIGDGNQAQASLNGESQNQQGNVTLSGSSLNANGTLGANAAASITGNNVSLTSSGMSAQSDLGSTNATVNAQGTFNGTNSNIAAIITGSSNTNQANAIVNSAMDAVLNAGNISATTTLGQAQATLKGGMDITLESNSGVNANSNSEGSVGATVNSTSSTNTVYINNSTVGAKTSGGVAQAYVNGNNITMNQAKVSSTSDIGTANSTVNALGWINLGSSGITADGGLGGANVNLTGGDDDQFSSISNSTLSATADFGDALVNATDGGVEINDSNFKASATGGSSSASVSGAITGDNVSVTANSSNDESTVESANASYSSSGFTLSDTPTSLTNSTITATNDTGNAAASASANNLSKLTISAQTSNGNAYTGAGMTNGDTISLSAITGSGDAEDYVNTGLVEGSINNLTMNAQGTGYLGPQGDDVMGLLLAYGEDLTNITITANSTLGESIAGVVNSQSCTNCNVSANSIDNDTFAYVSSRGDVKNSTATAISTSTPYDGANASLGAGGSIDSTDTSTATVVVSGSASAINISNTGSVSNVSASTPNGTWKEEINLGGYFPYYLWEQTGTNCNGAPCNPQPNVAKASLSPSNAVETVSPNVSVTNSTASSISQILSTTMPQPTLTLPILDVTKFEPLSLKKHDSDIHIVEAKSFKLEKAV